MCNIVVELLLYFSSVLELHSFLAARQHFLDFIFFKMSMINKLFSDFN